MNDKLCIKTLGGFSISYQDKILTNDDNRSKKLWTLLAYIIVYHTKEIPQSTLIDLFWSDERTSNDPENALKTSLHRLRTMLGQLEHSNKKLILHKRGTFRFNPEVPLEIDLELFESYCTLAGNLETEKEQRILYYKKAFELYHGDFIPLLSQDDWAVPLTIHYHSMYITMVQEYLLLLLDKENYDEMIRICCTASGIEPYDELIQYHFILSLYRSGQQQAAITQYNTCINMYYNDFGIDPSDQMQDLYKEIIKQKKSPQVNLSIIQEELIECVSEKGAYLCDYSIFKHLYQIEARSMERTGLSFFLCLFTIDSVGSDHKLALANAMKRLEEVIGSSLRSGDTYSRYSVNQYIVLLPSASYENSILVGERVLKNFSNSRPRISAKLSYNLKHMNPKNYKVTI